MDKDGSLLEWMYRIGAGIWAPPRTQRGLYSNTMALITSGCAAMRLSAHQMALITSGRAALQASRWSGPSSPCAPHPPPAQTSPSSVRRRSGTRWGTCIRAPHSGNRTTPNQRDDAALCSPSTDTTPSLWSGHHTTKETMQPCVLTVHPHETITISLVPWPPRPHTPATRPCSAGSTRGSRWPAGDVVVTAPHSSRSLWRIPTAAVGLTRHVVRALVCCGGKYAI